MNGAEDNARFGHIGGQDLEPGLEGKPRKQLVWMHEQQWIAAVNANLCYLIFPGDSLEPGYVALRVFKRSSLEKLNPGARVEKKLGTFPEWEEAVGACLLDYETNQ